MPKGEFLGEFEQFVLLALMRLGKDAYGMKVRQEIDQRTGRETAIGAVYATLDRLEQKGLVQSVVVESNAESGGRARRFYEITPQGIDSLRQSREAIAKLMEGLEGQWQER